MDGGAATYEPAYQAVKEIRGLRKDPSVKPLVISIGSGLGPQPKAPSSRSFVPNSVNTAIQAQEDLANRDDMEYLARGSSQIDIDFFRFDVDSGLEGLQFDTWSCWNSVMNH